MKVRLLLLPVGALAAALVGACGNPNAVHASLATIDDTAGVFALTGAPTSGPTGIDISFPRAVRTVPGTYFDVVLDIVNGQAIALPPAAVSAAGAAGIQLTIIPYDDITAAPTSGYKDSTSINLQVGTVFFVQSFSHSCNTQAVVANRYLYAKVIIDSIHFYPYDEVTAPAGRTIYYRMRNDPNCGYTSLLTGIPTY